MGFLLAHLIINFMIAYSEQKVKIVLPIYFAQQTPTRKVDFIRVILVRVQEYSII